MEAPVQQYLIKLPEEKRVLAMQMRDIILAADI
jgi:hypothetical protein